MDKGSGSVIFPDPDTGDPKSQGLLIIMKNLKMMDDTRILYIYIFINCLEAETGWYGG